MNLLAAASLYIWVPIVVIIFASRPPQRAVVIAFVFAWLFLPNISWKFSGIPDYSKETATIFGVLLSLTIFESSKLLALRLRWYDLPVIVNCLCPMGAALSTGAGAYEGLSAILDQLIRWGFPYLIGRVYFSDLKGLRHLAVGVAIGGLIYVPLCLIEIRMSPQFESWVYGIYHWEQERYGGYRPKVFLSSGLELGMWMTCSTLLAQRLWACGVVKTFQGMAFGKVLLAMVVTTILCKSTGALLLLMVGLSVLWMVSRTKASWPIWLLIAIVPLYTGTRVSGIWSGRELVEAGKFFGPDRAQSLEFRLENEDVLIAHAMKNPIFGGGREHGSQVVDAKGKALTIVDGYWMIILGQNGIIGLISLVTMLLMPIVLLMRRYPARSWTQSDVAPAAALAVMLALVMIDELSNGMLNPIYAMIVGGLSGMVTNRRKGNDQEARSNLEAALTMADEGDWDQSESLYRLAIEQSWDVEGVDGARVRAEALEGLGLSLLLAGQAEDAEDALRSALAARQSLMMESPEVDQYRELALARGRLGRALAQLGRVTEAIHERREALDLWDRLSHQDPEDEELRDLRAQALNDLAWLIAAESESGDRDPEHAVRLAEEAIQIAPGLEAGWNTLGVARYRAGDWAGSVEALERSILGGPTGGTAFDHFFLAMAHQQLGDEARARESFDSAVTWSELYRSGDPELGRFRDEAIAVLYRPKKSEIDAF